VKHLRSAVRGIGIEHLANEGRGIVTASFGVVSKHHIEFLDLVAALGVGLERASG
jgi:hypothetical protein